MSYDLCFLCGKTNRNILEEIEFVSLVTEMPASHKPLQTVLEHLASCIRTKLIFSTDTTICKVCYNELAEYDDLMVKLMSNQRVLTNRLQTILSTRWKTEEEVEALEVDFEQISDSQLADALNPELDTKEELVEGDDIIIQDTKDGMVEDDEIILNEFISESEENDDLIMEIKEENYIDEEDANATENSEYKVENTENILVLKPREVRECVHCGENFKTKNLLKTHVLQNHKVQVFACKICGVQRKDEEYLELHMNIHHGKTEFECRFCDKTFSRPVNTLRHMRKHWDKKGFQCEKCGERFSLDNVLYNHRLRHLAEENPLICSICNQSFKSIKTYNHHQLIHQENRPRHQCPLCPKSFTERYTLKLHMSTHGTAQEIEIATAAMKDAQAYEENTCVICEAKFLTKELLNTHLKDNHNVVLK